MSEFQLYEFQALDRTLTSADREYLEQLSSRVSVTATSAQFNYSYGSFRGEPLEILERCFDIMLYQANFGVIQLAIRVPKEIAAPDLYEPYCVPYGISIKQTSKSIIVDISLSYEEYSGGWLSDEGDLVGIVPLRTALMKGDLRMLYLAWLATGYSSESFDWDNTIEPPVPPNLNQLSPELICLVNIFDIGTDLIAVAASNSESVSVEFTEPIEEWISALSENERTRYLLRVAEGGGGGGGGEINVGVELMQRLRQQFGKTPKSVSVEGRRTFAELVSAAEEKTQERQQAAQKLAADAEQARIKSLGGPKVESQWLVVERLVKAGQAKNYNEAVGRVEELRAIAEESGKLKAFNARLKELKQTASRKKSFISKLLEAEL